MLATPNRNRSFSDVHVVLRFTTALHETGKAGFQRESAYRADALLALPLPAERIGGADRFRHHPRLYIEWLIVNGLAFRRAARRDLIQHLVRHSREPNRRQGGG